MDGWAKNSAYKALAASSPGDETVQIAKRLQFHIQRTVRPATVTPAAINAKTASISLADTKPFDGALPGQIAGTSL